MQHHVLVLVCEVKEGVLKRIFLLQKDDEHPDPSFRHKFTMLGGSTSETAWRDILANRLPQQLETTAVNTIVGALPDEPQISREYPHEGKNGVHASVFLCQLDEEVFDSIKPYLEAPKQGYGIVVDPSQLQAIMRLGDLGFLPNVPSLINELFELNGLSLPIPR